MKIAIIGEGKIGEIIKCWLLNKFKDIEIEFFDETKGRHPREITDEKIIISSGHMNFRRRIFKDFPREQFININRSIYDDNDLCMGVNNLIFPNVHFDMFHEIGDNNVISSGSIINHHCKIGSGNLFGPACIMSGSVNIGNNCTFGSGIIIQPYVTIGDNVTIPSGTVITGNIVSNSRILVKMNKYKNIYQGERIIK